MPVPIAAKVASVVAAACVEAQAAAAANPYGASTLGANNAFAVPDANGETGAPFQPLSGVPNNPPVEIIPTPSQPFTPLPAEPTAEATTHTVVKGDTIWGLAQKYGGTQDAIRQANNLTTDVIWIGQHLIIPAR